MFGEHTKECFRVEESLGSMLPDGLQTSPRFMKRCSGATFGISGQEVAGLPRAAPLWFGSDIRTPAKI